MTNATQHPLALVGVKDKPNDVTQALSAMQQAGYPIAAPGGTVMCPSIPAGFAVGITAIKFSKDDTYQMDGVTCLKATALNRLARGLGISWLPETFRRLDDQTDPHYCSFVVAGEYRDYTGELVRVVGTRAVDLRDGSPEAKLMKAGQLARARVNIAQIAETKAKNRAIADACIGRQIHPRDLEREFVMAKVYRVEPVAPGMATDALYGRQAAPAAAPATEAETRHVNDAEVRDAPQEPTRTTGASVGFCVPNDEASFGADAGKPLAEASDGTLSRLLDQMSEWLERNAESPHASGVRRKAQAVEAEIGHRQAGGATRDEAPF